MLKKLVVIKRCEDNLRGAVDSIMRETGLCQAVRPGSRVAVKPNFTFPHYKEGVTTSPMLIGLLCEALRDMGARVSVCESDGGYHSWKAEDAFRGHGIYAMEKRYGIRAVNLSRGGRVHLHVHKGGRRYEVPFPRLLKEEADVFITMPVPKVHCMTGVSLALKNQWGVIPDTMRLGLHPVLCEALAEITANLPESFVVADAVYFLDRSGPMYGTAIKKDLVIGSNHMGAFDLVLCEVMGVSVQDIGHLRHAMARGIVPSGMDEVEVNLPLAELRYPSTLKRSFRQRLMRNCFESELLTYLLYTSGFGMWAHRIFYKVRPTPEHLKGIGQAF